jgi:hypothetical protein
MLEAGDDLTSIQLASGDVLVAGGESSEYGGPISTAELYTPVLAQVSPTSGPVGQAVTVSGSGYYAHEEVGIYWDGVGPPLARARTTATGTFTVKTTVPKSPQGANLIVGAGTKSFASAQTTFNVTP